MKRAFTAFVVLVTLCSAVLLAQAPAAKSPIFGTWKLIPAKSTFSPGPPLKSQVARLEAVDGGMKVAADRVEADGKATHFEWTAKFDGKDYPVKGDAARDAVTVKKIDDYTLEITNKKAGKVTTTIKAVYAKDGKTLYASQADGSVIIANVAGYCYPWFNMGRVYEHQHSWKRARECYRKAFEANRQYRVALAGYRRLQAMWN